MSEHTRSSIVISAPAAEVMAAVADFASYPRWAGEITAAEVVEPGADGGRPRQVRLVLDAGPVRDIQLHAYCWDGDRQVSWSLIESRMLSALSGSYILTPLDATRTRVTYQLTLTMRVPMLGLLKRQAEKVIIDRALAGLRRHVESVPTKP